jgi:peptide deformylase
MSLSKIVKIPDTILKKKSRKATKDELAGQDMRELAEQMHKDMVAAKGVGLAANQVNEDVALFVIDKELAKENEVPNTFVNPEITEYSAQKDDMEEGCLSIPEFYVQIRRSKKIMIKAMDLEGNKLKFKARGFLARVLQHETDHLYGITIKDRVERVGK